MTDTIINEYKPEIVSLPGDTLRDVLEERGMKQTDLAARLGKPIKLVNEIIKGKARITSETALKLELVLDIPASFWINRQSHYDEAVARQRETEQFANNEHWIDLFPIKEMKNYGYIKNSQVRRELFQELLQFFQIASPSVFDKKYLVMQTQFCQSVKFTPDLYSVSAWLQQGRVKAHDIRCAPFNKTQFKKSLLAIRKLTREIPESFIPKLQRLCSSYGVAVVFVPELPRTRAFGAMHWDGNKPIIQLCLRGKKDDRLWFTFFHEAAHLLFNRKKSAIFYDPDAKRIRETENHEGCEEEHADTFAADILIPPDKLDQYLKNHSRYSRESILSFAQSIDVAPSIVVGRLQHLGKIPFTYHNKLRVTYKWVEK
jgi:HTH-type transcriptional regulator / antitoxin HigA